jgi:hypothetical protein
MNWIGFNTAQDVFPQGSSGGPLPCLTGPIVETHAGRFDDPAAGNFDYDVIAQRTGYQESVKPIDVSDS